MPDVKQPTAGLSGCRQLIGDVAAGTGVLAAVTSSRRAAAVVELGFQTLTTRWRQFAEHGYTPASLRTPVDHWTMKGSRGGNAAVENSSSGGGSAVFRP